MLKVIRRVALQMPNKVKELRKVIEKLETWKDRREPNFALGGQQSALRRRHSSKTLCYCRD